MKSIVLCVLFLSVANCLPKSTKVLFKDVVGNGRIIDGQPAKSGQFPWQARLGINTQTGQGTCGGALINNRWILTAAHCLQIPQITSITVKLGGLLSNLNTVEPGTIMISTDKFYHHEDFNSFTLENDIGLIDLNRDVESTDTIEPVPIHEYLKDDITIRVSGWGKTSDSSGVSPTLQFVDLTAVNKNVCEAIYGSLSNNFICGKGADTKSTCNGDSGGPVVVQNSEGIWSHVGIVSFGHINGCTLGYPVGFTRTSGFISWIENTINSN